MALSIEKGTSCELWSVPVAAYGDNDWSDNTWLVDHLRMLADKIEQENPKIYAVSIRSTIQYAPTICVEVFSNQNQPVGGGK